MRWCGMEVATDFGGWARARDQLVDLPGSNYAPNPNIRSARFQSLIL